MSLPAALLAATALWGTQQVGLHGDVYHGYGYRYVMPQVGSWTRTAPTGTKCTTSDGSPQFSHVSLDRSGTDQERTHYVDVNVWRELATACADLSKGDPVFVIGRLVNDSWTDREGNKRYTTRIEGQRVEFLTRGPGGGGAGTRPAESRQGARASVLDIDEAEFPPEEELPF